MDMKASGKLPDHHETVEGDFREGGEDCLIIIISFFAFSTSCLVERVFAFVFVFAYHYLKWQ